MDSSMPVKIAVVGVGGAGCNTISRLTRMGIKSADTIAINTDVKHLNITEANKRMLIGQNITRGLGAGGFPEVAQKCAEAARDSLHQMFQDIELVFISAGMGGGTGTGAAPVVAQVAKEEGAIVVAMVTFPFALERARLDKARWGIKQMQKYCDTVVVIDNNRLVSYVPNLPMNEAFAVADNLLGHAVKGIADTIMFPSLINIDFADLRSVMENGGVATISIGEGKGTDKVNSVVNGTLQHPLLDVDYHGAKGALIHITGGLNLTLGEATEIGEKITNVFDDDASVKLGARLMPDVQDEIKVTAIITGVTSPHITGAGVPEVRNVRQADALEVISW